MKAGFKLVFLFFSFLFLFGLLLTTDTPEPVAQEISEEITPGKICPPNQFLVSGEFCTDSNGDPFTCQICDYCGNGIPTSSGGNIEACDQAPGGPIVVNPDSAGCEGGQEPVACNNCELVCNNCGNDQVDIGETCDGLIFGLPNINNNECINCSFCGDGATNDGEACDDGDSDNFNECSNTCVASICGDGILQDPNNVGTSENCDQETISQELIDLGLTSEDVYCPDCRALYCGDGIVTRDSLYYEECDTDSGGVVNYGDVDGDGEITPADTDQLALEQIVGCDINCNYVYGSDLIVTKFITVDTNVFTQADIEITPTSNASCEGTELEVQIANNDVVRSTDDAIFNYQIENPGELEIDIHTLTDPDLAELFGIPEPRSNFIDEPFTLQPGEIRVFSLLDNPFNLPRGLHHNSGTAEGTDEADNELRTTSTLDICVSGCGDGYIDSGAEPPEQCDPPGGNCGADCQIYTNVECGNGILENQNFPPDIDEFCDGDEIISQADSGLSPAQYDSAICANNSSVVCGASSTCELLYCDDGKLTDGEGCDSVGGSFVKFESPGSSCTAIPLEDHEYCSSDCILGGCGDEFWEPSKEACDESAASVGLPTMPADKEAAGYTCSNCELLPPESPTPTPTDTMPPFETPSPSPSCPPDGYVTWRKQTTQTPYAACMYAAGEPDKRNECCGKDEYYDRNCQDDICGFLPTRNLRNWCRYSMRFQTPCNCVNDAGQAACVRPYDHADNRCEGKTWASSWPKTQISKNAPCAEQAMRLVPRDFGAPTYFSIATCELVGPYPDGVVCDSGQIIMEQPRILVRASGLSMGTGSPISLNFGPEKPWTLAKFKIDPKQSHPWTVWKGSSNRPLLVYDPEETGVVKSAAQLFGNWTFYDTKLGKKAKQKSQGKDYLWEHGYHALKELDHNKDGWLRNYVFEKDELDDLALWFDNNQNGISEPGEVRKLDEFDITGINTNYDHIETYGDVVSQRGFERIIDGERTYGQTIDWYTSYYSSRQDAILDYVKKSDKLREVKQYQAGLLEILENDNYVRDKLTGRNNKINGQWYWQANEYEDANGILSINVADGQLNGFSLVGRMFKQQQSDHVIVGFIKYELNGNLITSNSKYDTYLMKIEHNDETTETYVIHDKAADTLSAESVHDGLSEQLNYTWKGVRKE